MDPLIPFFHNRFHEPQGAKRVARNGIDTSVLICPSLAFHSEGWMTSAVPDNSNADSHRWTRMVFLPFTLLSVFIAVHPWFKIHFLLRKSMARSQPRA
jgi:hypothetical protein